MSSSRLPLGEDWTAANGRTNSSPLFNELAGEIGFLIRDSAHSIVRGNTDAVGRLILAQLAHKHGLAPAREALGA